MFRLIASAVLLVCVSISAYYRHRARKQGGTIPRRSERTFLCWVRHPLYSTGLLLIVSIGLMTASWLILAFTTGAFLLFRFLIVPMEEQQLLLKFGDDYRAMMNRTDRFFPGM